MEYKKTAKKILDLVGGQKNINDLTHCVTRLRFKLKKTELADTEALNQLDGVISVIQKGGQYQIVIGQEVDKVFDEVIELIGGNIIEDSVEEKNVSLLDELTTMISGIFTQILGILAAAGMLKGVLAALTSASVLSTESGTYQVLYSISNTLFYFLPIFLGAATAKYFNMDQFLGMAIGAVMVYPDIINLASQQTPLSFFGMPMNLINYSSSVFPVIVSVWLASKIEKRIAKFTPKGIKFFIVPLVVMLITVPLTFFIVGPLVTFLSSVLSNVTLAIYNFNPILGGLVLGGPWILIVMFGLHWTFIPIFLNSIATNGSSSLLGLLTAGQFAMAGATIAIALKTKNIKTKNLAWSTGVTCLFGISEPTIYGLLLPLKKPLIMSIIGGSIGGAIAGFFKSKLYAIGGIGLFQFPLAINPEGLDAGFYGLLISAAVGFVIGLILTFVLGYNPNDDDKNLEEL